MFSTLNHEDLRRINVVGVSGSGKSWVSRRLADVLDSPVVELDRLHWGPNWTEYDTEAIRQQLEAVVQRDCWIVDGNYHNQTHDIKWRNATLVVWIDNTFRRTAWQALTRAVRRAWSQDEIWPGTGNRETFRGTFFSSDSVLLWAIRTFHATRRRYSELERDHTNYGFRFVRLRGCQQIAEFLKGVEASTR
jgi:adenylate kinase family enzyme